MEQIDSDAWFDGKTDQEWIPGAVKLLKEASEEFRIADVACSSFKEWFPAERREELTPDIDFFRKTQKDIGQIVELLEHRKLPKLRLVHGITAAMSEAITVGNRKALALRGTPGHHPAGAE
jgi:hypothetical protein